MQILGANYLKEIMADAHARTLELVAGLDEEQLIGPKLPIVNPLRWELGHVAWFHEKFILRDLGHPQSHDHRSLPQFFPTAPPRRPGGLSYLRTRCPLTNSI